MSIRAQLEEVDTPPLPITSGMLPMEPSIVGTAVDAMLINQRNAEGDRPHAFNRRLRGSWAGWCSRRIGFELIGFPPDIDLDGQALRIFDAGDRAHGLLQSAMQAAYNMAIEVAADWWPTLSLGCNLDGVYDYGGVTAFEAKSMAPLGFEITTGQRNRGESPGPKYEHILQSGLGALSPTVGAEKVHIVYYNKATSEIADWVFGVDEPLPHLEGRTVRGMVADEIRRMTGILNRVDNGELPKAVVPGYGVVENPPAKGSKGQPWTCRYCAFQPTCSRLGPGVITIEHLKTNTHKQKRETA